MGQVTEETCRLIIEYADRDDRFPLTVNEMRQLAYLASQQIKAGRRTTPDREVVTKLAEINGQLREQIYRYQAVCAAAYQLVCVVDGPLRFLDALSNAANGEPMSTEDALNLLPVTLDECDSFSTVPTSDKGGA
ncbi:Uncharacterised protein [Burkholderia pseudomallei]|uniref:hypothetical protein n=1 Tax=Burkholderia pseudomallei TaxID=28450 RepID=UPI000572295B|nr:hypothetical protein [Burkholderia pseudomallei]MCE2035861.1 hypothetical protein [Burkholderia pseudomallei CS]MCE2041869.1 hypothetical protein [Burkholderia pseudomallei CB]OAG64859.1 hypothetical protein BIM11_5728 [Burkholderia pseudomallei]QFS13096.1 hypothetical protein H10_33410 [Burkholderia pseudomallei]CAK1286846.1 Uncharacterised protein [Burkholderia pseudomallei]